MALTKIMIQNFQAHSILELELDSGITTIVGASDVGKSTIIRALRWVATNRPSGEAFIKDGEKSTEVRVEVDGHHILRTRGKENAYGVNGLKLEAFGTEVPENVVNILQLAEINFQGQFDTPFWFSESAPEVSRQLNSIVDLSVMDTTLSTLISKLKTAKTETTVIQERLDQISGERKALSHYRKMDEDLKAVESRAGALEGTRTQRQALDALIQGAFLLQEKITINEKVVMAWGVVAESSSRLQEIRKERKALSAIIKEVEENQSKASMGIPDLSPIIRQQDCYQQALLSRKALARDIREIQEKEEIWGSRKQEAEKAAARLKKEMGEVCPLCNQPIR